MMKIPRIMIAAIASGSGKTTFSCALMAALKKKGMQVAACKCGPDYIDPMFHREVLGIDSENLDLFFCDEDRLKERFLHHAGGADIAVIEGVMGYYDGMMLESEKASSYDVARTLRAPVILVLPCKGMAVSVLAVLKGIMEFRGDSNIKGIVLNRILPMLYPKMKEMIETQLANMGHEIQVVGYIPENEAFHLESRHLGLILPGECERLERQIEEASRVLAETVDLEQILGIAKEAEEFLTAEQHASEGEEKAWEAFEKAAGDTPLYGVRIGIARDEAFCFYYKDNLEFLKKRGCEIVPFSPLHDEQLPENLGGILLGGGYPEVYAKGLAENGKIKQDIRKQILRGLPCIAECGGFLYLQEFLEGEDGADYPMAGVLPGNAVRKDRLVRFGYIEIYAKKDGRYLKNGESLRGHEFHYWDSSENGEDCLAVKPNGSRKWQAIHMEGNLFAGFPHLYWYSNPEFGIRFARECAQYQKKGC